MPEMLEQALRRQAGALMDGMCNQNTSSPKMELQNPYTQENADMVAENPTLCRQTSDVISFQERAGKPGGGKGILIQNEHTGALSTLNNQPVCYGISSFDSNAMKSANPHSGIYEAETARTLDLNGGSPACNQGGMAVVCATTEMTPKIDENETAFSLRSRDYKDPQVVCIEGNGSRPSHKGDGYAESETMYTLNSTETHAVAYNGSNITSPINASNPKEGDPCHTLTDDNRNYVVIENHPADSRVKISEDGIIQTLSSRMGAGGGNVPMDTYQKITGSLCASGYDKLGTQEALNDMYVVGKTIVGDDVTPTLVSRISSAVGNTQDNLNVITYGLDRAAYNQGINAQYDFSIEKEKIATQIAKGPGAVWSSLWRWIVRRLTPMECERLQGFPDHWTDIGEWVDSKGKKHKDADSPRYKALGNSIAVGYANGKSGFWCWMAGRMVNQLRQAGVDKPTMASLFDGIGGFPLAYSAYGCKPVWASEIEEFPIAVTKIRFPENEEDK